MANAVVSLTVSEFVHLHNHSDFSLLRASATVAGLVKTAQKLGQRAIALTDDGNLFGALKFYKECSASQKSDKPEAGLKPIVGCDFFLALGSRLEKGNNENANRYHRIVLLAKNRNGYQNISLMSSAAYTEGFYYRPRIDKELLSRHSADTIALSGGMGGEIPSLLRSNRVQEARKAAEFYRELFGKDRFFLELSDHGITEQKIINQGLLELAKDLDLPLVASNDCYYLKKEDSLAHDVLLCIGSKRKRHEAGRFKFSSNEFYLKSSQEMEALFGHIPHVLSNTLLIAEQCNLKLDLPGPLLPDYDVPTDFLMQSSEQMSIDLDRLATRFANDSQKVRQQIEDPATRYFVWLSNRGLQKRYGDLPENSLIERLDFELHVIIRMGFVGYFLIVGDFIRYAKDHGIPVGPGRGSGAGSIVAYSMDITDIDPIRYNLLFERFLNPERVSMPDFDIDFCYERRSEVIDYVTQKYGKERVGQIITFGTLRPKAAIKDVARAIDISFGEANQIVKHIPDGPTAAKLHLKDLISEAQSDYWSTTYKDKADETRKKFLSGGPFCEQANGVKELYGRGGIYQELFDISIGLEGLARHASTHAAGVVIGREELTKYVPLFRDPKTGAISTQFTMDMLEECGLVKMDFLGLKTLTLISNTEALIRKTVDANFDIMKVSDTDKKTFEMLGEGRSSAVFQFDGDGMQATLKKAKPTCIEDLIALTSLYRPGPMEYIPQFIDCKWGRKAISYPHPSLEGILKETYGIMVYQEQVMQAAQIVAGYSLGGADMLRRAMGKKKKDEMDKQRATFIKGAALQHSIGADKANEIFDILDKFAGYGFNKSHAAAYSLVSYRTAYLKANFPAQFMAANLSNEISVPDKFRLYLTESRAMGIEVLPPDVNVSQLTFTVDKGRIVFGIVGVKGIGAAVVEEILNQRRQAGSFASIQDFLDRVDLRTVNRKAMENLIYSGCLDSIIPNRQAAMSKLDQIMAAALAKKDGKKFGQSGLFDDAPQEEYREVTLDGQEFELLEKLAKEKELLGNYFSGHPLDSVRSDWERATNLDLSRVDFADPEKRYQLIAQLTSLRFVITKRGKRMGIANFEDYNGNVEAVFFADNLDKFESQLVVDQIFGLICKVDLERGKAQIVVEEIRLLGDLEDRQGGELHVRLKTGCSNNNEALYRLRSTLFGQSGSCPVYLHLKQDTDPSEELIIRPARSLLASSQNEVLSEVASNPCVSEVWKIYPAMLRQKSRLAVELDYKELMVETDDSDLWTNSTDSSEADEIDPLADEAELVLSTDV